MPAKVRLAFLGFRHNHIMGFYQAARSHDAIEVVAAAEDHEPTIQSLERDGKVALTHWDWREVIDRVPCDAVAVGDYFSRRGEIIIAALQAGKHVIADKPICTKLDELDRIETLTKSKSLVVSALLDLRDSGAFIATRRLIRKNAVGEIHTINVTAQHPLLLEKRPAWYFEPGKQGGTINDIAVHATDLIPWLTGRTLTDVASARAWNARLPQFPQFQDAAQFMLKLDNGGGVLGDVSYLAPDGVAYAMPQYWRVTCHGSSGVIEAKLGAPTIQLTRQADRQIQNIPADANVEHGRLDAFLREMRGETSEESLITADVLRASRCALMIQESADQNSTNVCLT